MTDDAYLRALIADTRGLERDYQMSPRREEWRAEDIRDVISGNPEINRLARQGRIATMYASAEPSHQSDIERLARVADDL